jgi:plastocyanin
MKNFYFLLFIGLFLSAQYSYGAVHTVSATNTQFTFNPSTVTANVGDTVAFSLGSIHTASQVDSATWAANSSSPHIGFSFGGGIHGVQVASPGIYYYICDNHASMGMKGRIIVTDPSAVPTITASSGTLNVSPNPFVRSTIIKTNLPEGKKNTMKIIDLTGRCVYEKENVSSEFPLELTGLHSGTYLMTIRADDMLLEKKIVITE